MHRLYHLEQADLIAITLPSAHLLLRASVRPLEVAHPGRHALHKQTVTAETPEPPSGVVRRQAAAHHSAPDEVGNPDPCGPGSEYHHALFAERAPRGSHR